jgi:sialate O-acetylesterase
MLAASVLASVDSRLLAQGPSLGKAGVPTPVIKLREPAASRVYQRDVNGRAEIPIVVDEAQKGVRLVGASINNSQGFPLPGVKLLDGKLIGVPAGGPYTIWCQTDLGGNMTVGPVYVGDLWVLAGQSNMQGLGDLIDVTPPHPQVMTLGMDTLWRPAEEPLHWLVDSPDPVHSGDPTTRAERSAREHKSRTKGAGLGLPFAAAMVESTGIPVGLVICAHGGTSMEQWSPARKDEGGHSLYGSMLRQFRLAGGKVKGVLWYQGESDAMGKSDPWTIYPKVFSDFIAAVRTDFGQPELPFYFVQIGRFVAGVDPKGWNAVQDAQGRLPERVSYTAVISVIDLELDDGIHVGTQGLKRAGHRLARIAQRELFGQVGATTPTLDRVTKGPHDTLVVKFKGVNMGSKSPARPLGAMIARPGLDPSLTPSENGGIGLRPERHIAGFSIRSEDGALLPLIYEACVGNARDTVLLKLTRRIPEKASLWYGYGLDPDCNLTDGLDMAVPVFGPIPLDEIPGPASAPPVSAAGQVQRGRPTGTQTSKSAPIKLLIITGDHGHAWKETTRILSDFLGKDGRIQVDVTTTPGKDLTTENLAKYDVLLLNYRDTPKGEPETRWSQANKDAFLKAVHDGKGLVVYHHASSAFIKPNWEEFEKAIAGGWRSRGYHGPKHVFTVKKTDVKHPISDGLPTQFVHAIDELYQDSVMVPGSEVLATAYSDKAKPRGTGKDEPVIWVNHYGHGRVYENVLGHDAEAMADQNFQDWMRRGVIWAAGKD